MTNIHIKVRCGCNFKCWYCVGKNKVEKVEEFNLDHIKEFLESIDEKNFYFSLECGASEPSLHPQIKELIQLLTKFGVVSIPTNNSIHPDKWLSGCAYNQLNVRCALHPENEANLDRFIQYIMFMKSKNAKVSCVFCASPDRLNKFRSFSDLFKDKQISFSVVPFIGEFNKKIYPQAYTQEEQKLLFGIKNEKSNDWYQRLKPLVTTRDFYGIPCLAGFRLFYIDSKKIFRCLYDKIPIERPFKKAVPCRVHNCGCGFFLEEFNQGDIKISPSEDFEKEFEKIINRYFNLMKKYGKLKKIN